MAWARMHTLWVKVLLLLLAALCSGAPLEERSVTVALLAALLSFLLDLLPRKPLRWALYGVFALLCWQQPLFLWALPLLLYSGVEDLGYWAAVALPLAFLVPHNAGVLLLLSLAGGYFAWLHRQIEQQELEKNHIRDDYKEQLLRSEAQEARLAGDRDKDVQIAVLSERNRIARALHDSIGHAISSAILQAEALKTTASGEQQAQMDTLQETLQTGLFDIRSSLHALYSTSFDLEKKLRELLAQTPQLQSELRFQVTEEMPPAMKYGVLSAVREALTNVQKHSDATAVQLQVQEQPSFYSVTVKDNGTRPPKAGAGGLGLLSVDEFARKYGGFSSHGYQNGFYIHFILKKEGA